MAAVRDVPLHRELETVVATALYDSRVTHLQLAYVYAAHVLLTLYRLLHAVRQLAMFNFLHVGSVGLSSVLHAADSK